MHYRLSNITASTFCNECMRLVKCIHGSSGSEILFTFYSFCFPLRSLSYTCPLYPTQLERQEALTAILFLYISDVSYISIWLVIHPYCRFFPFFIGIRLPPELLCVFDKSRIFHPLHISNLFLLQKRGWVYSLLHSGKTTDLSNQA